MTIDGVAGVRFAVWAPNASRVAVVGDFNAGTRAAIRCACAIRAGVWELFVPRVGAGARYKFEIVGAGGVLLPLKADPLARADRACRRRPPRCVAEPPPSRWNDDAWMAARGPQRQAADAPISIYEVHLGSWMRGPRTAPHRPGTSWPTG